jgi:ligand-binding SRPBCC domain-containing protein
MKTYKLERCCILPVDIDAAWQFFSDPQNLDRISPRDMDFRIMSQDLPPKIYSGLTIQYTVAPLWGIRMKWLSKIKAVQEPYFFIDEQLEGPYAYWQHAHRFESLGSQTRMTDTVDYAIPYAALGMLANKLIVRKKLEYIFDYRAEAIDKLFPQSVQL